MIGFPEVVITCSTDADGKNAVPARRARVVVGDYDLTDWVTDFRVGGEVKGAIELDLKLLVSGVRWENPAGVRKAPVVEVHLDQDRLAQMIQEQVAKNNVELARAVDGQRS